MKFLIFLITGFFTILCTSQELPPVVNFSSSEYGAGNQNWMISQDADKNMYLANGSGLLEYNGAEWNLYPMPNNTIVRSVKVVADKVFTGAYMEAGFWKRDKFGVLKYNSLIDKFPAKVSDGEQFWHIESTGDIVIFQGFEKLYLYNLNNSEISLVEVERPKPIKNLFNVKGKIYFQQEGVGLFLIKNGQPELLIPSNLYNDLELVHLYTKDKQLQLISKSGEFFKWDGKGLIQNNYQLSSELRSLSVFCALSLETGSLILGTVENGIYHISPSGDILENYNQTNGLLNNTILSLYVDKDKNLWSGLDNGIAVININSPFKIYQDNNGNIGSVYTSYKDDEYLYLGTNQGLYYKKDGEREFKFVEGTNGQIWSLQKLDNVLFCGHNTGTFIINGDKAKKVAERSGTWNVVRMEGHPGFYLQGHYNGLSVLQIHENNFKAFPVFKKFPHSSKSIVSDANGEIWVSNEHKGVFKLKLNDLLSEITSSQNYTFKDDSGITSSLFILNDSLYYATKRNFYQYRPTSDEFSAKNMISQVSKVHERISGTVVDDEKEGVWGFTENSIFRIGMSQLSSGYNLQSIYLPREIRSITNGHENITSLNDGSYLLGVSNGYITFDKLSTLEQSYEVKINAISNATLDNQANLVSLEDRSRFDYKFNNVSFKYSIPEYQKFISPDFSFRLKGQSSNWSAWGKNTTASFKNLSFGDYEFQLKAKIGNQPTEIVSYRFEILRPWYLSGPAIVGYILLFIIILALVHKAYLRHHTKLNEENEKALRMKHLEAEQKIIMLQKEQLEKEMANNNRELAATTMSLIKKNEFLNSIKNKLKDSQDRGDVKSVISTIDKDISEEDNWNFFKEAFSNADKDFFKKVKNKHPELSSNDLKLCAYLRLNLSSKEIAPLLNISVKSVEIKRYRLRKKMELDREINLTDYILSI